MPAVTPRHTGGDRDDDDLLAAEFALGLLDESDAATVLQRARADAALSLRIAWWRDQLAPLIAEIAVDPRDGLWPAIAARLASNDNDGRALRRWRAGAIGSGVLAAALLLFIGLRPDAVAPPPPAPVVVASAPLVGMLGAEGEPAIAMVSYDDATGMLTVAPAALDPGDGDAELWVIPEGGAPISLGVIDRTRPATRTVPEARRALMTPRSTFAVSFEPAGGSPTGSPTGPVVATGKITRA